MDSLLLLLFILMFLCVLPIRSLTSVTSQLIQFEFPSEYVAYTEWSLKNFFLTFLAALDPCGCMQSFSSRSRRELLSSSSAQASHCSASLDADRGLYSMQASVAEARGLSCPVAYVESSLGPESEPVSPELVGGLNHWTTRDIQECSF